MISFNTCLSAWCTFNQLITSRIELKFNSFHFHKKVLLRVSVTHGVEFWLFWLHLTVIFHVPISCTCITALKKSCSKGDEIYYHRELLCHSLDGNRIDLITVTNCNNMSSSLEPYFDDKLFPDRSSPRCRAFHNKKVCNTLIQNNFHHE